MTSSFSFGRSRAEPVATRELYRILGLPARAWTDEQLREMQAAADAVLCLPGGTMRTKPIQAWALCEAHYMPGLFCPIGVGEGKTLISLCVPTIMRATRPMLLVPAALVEKTKRDMRALAQHFRIANYIRIYSFELLGRPQSEKILEQWGPDLIIADEVHRLKNRRAAVTRRVLRYMHGHPDTRFVALSGTITRRSLREYSHLIHLALRGPGTPLPVHESEVEDWAAVLDEGAPEDATGMGALSRMLGKEDSYDLKGLRNAFRRRLTQTYGVVASPDKPVDCSLIIERDRIQLPADLLAHIAKVKKDYTTPNGETFADAFACYRHVRELLLGFFYFWTPAAPREWLEKRKTWASLCRYIISNNRRGLDSEVPVINAVDRGLYPEAEEPLKEWREIRDTYNPTTTPMWLSDVVVRHVAARLDKEPGTIGWVEHGAFGRMLSHVSGLPYFAQGGKAPGDKSILDAPAGVSLIASVASNREGLNLQHKFHKNYIASMNPDAARNEQLLGRTHREGQLEDEVLVKILVAGEEHEDAIEKALAQARYMRETTGANQKLLLADFV